MAKMVSYRSEAFENGDGPIFVQYAKDYVPKWAVDVFYYEDPGEGDENEDEEGYLHEEDA